MKIDIIPSKESEAMSRRAPMSLKPNGMLLAVYCFCALAFCVILSGFTYIVGHYFRWDEVQSAKIKFNGKLAHSSHLYQSVKDPRYLIISGVDPPWEPGGIYYIIDLPDKEIDVPNQAGSDFIQLPGFLYTYYRIPFSMSLTQALDRETDQRVAPGIATFPSTDRTNVEVTW